MRIRRMFEHSQSRVSVLTVIELSSRASSIAFDSDYLGKARLYDYSILRRGNSLSRSGNHAYSRIASSRIDEL